MENFNEWKQKYVFLVFGRHHCHLTVTNYPTCIIQIGNEVTLYGGVTTTTLPYMIAFPEIWTLTFKCISDECH